MEKAENFAVPYVVHEAAMARQERTIKRLWILCIILIVLFVGSNAAWIHYENQFVDEVTETITATSDDGGNAYGTIIDGHYNGVHYGESNGQKDKNQNP